MQHAVRSCALAALLLGQLGACHWIASYAPAQADRVGDATQDAPSAQDARTVGDATTNADAVADVLVAPPDLGLDGAKADAGCPDPAGACQGEADWIETGGTCGATACVKFCGSRELECQAPPAKATWCKCYLCGAEVSPTHNPSKPSADQALSKALAQGYCKP